MFGNSYEFLTQYIQAGMRDCPVDKLKEFAGSPFAKIRLRVAENEQTPVDILEMLARDQNADVKIAVGTNAKTPLEVALKLASDEDLTVRVGLAENCATPIDVLEKLRDDSNAYVSYHANKTLTLLWARELNERRFGHRRSFGNSNDQLRYA